MRIKKYKAYKINEIENEFCEKKKDFVYFKDVDLFVFQKTHGYQEKQGIDVKTILYNALAYNTHELQEGMYIEVNGIKYNVRNIRNFGHKVFLELRED